MVSKEAFKFIVDEPPKLGGNGLGKKLPPLQRISWKAEGEYDLQGVRGTSSEVDARFQSISCQGTVQTEATQEDLDQLIKEVEALCIIAATLRASGADVKLALFKGEVQEDQEFKSLLESKDTTGKVTGDPGREADSPQFAGTGGHGAARARGYHTSAFMGQASKDGVEDESELTSMKKYGKSKVVGKACW